MMTLEFHCATDTGRARNNNEDSVAVDEATSLAVLADGMGGYNAGEVASSMAPRSSRPSSAAGWPRPPSRPTDTDVRRAMDICVDNANRAIFNAAELQPAVRRHGHDAGGGGVPRRTGCCSATSATRAATACAPAG